METNRRGLEFPLSLSRVEGGTGEVTKEGGGTKFMKEGDLSGYESRYSWDGTWMSGVTEVEALRRNRKCMWDNSQGSHLGDKL